MGATRALVTVRMPDGRLVYINDRALALDAVQAITGPSGPAVPVADDVSQRVAVAEAGLRVQKELAADGEVLPCLSDAIRALRALNNASGRAKHEWGQNAGARVLRDLVREHEQGISGGEEQEELVRQTEEALLDTFVDQENRQEDPAQGTGEGKGLNGTNVQDHRESGAPQEQAGSSQGGSLTDLESYQEPDSGSAASSALEADYPNLLHQGKELETEFAKDDSLPDPDGVTKSRFDDVSEPFVPPGLPPAVPAESPQDREFWASRGETFEELRARCVREKDETFEEFLARNVREQQDRADSGGGTAAGPWRSKRPGRGRRR